MSGIGGMVSGIKWLIGGIASYELLRVMKGASKPALRPPGAAEEDEFLALCSRCGKCNQACPYDAILMAGPEFGIGLGTPYIHARESPCRLCEDFPCVEACPTGALSGIKVRPDVNMGEAVISKTYCIAWQGIRCEVCYRNCPFIDEAITLEFSLRHNDPTHSVFGPVVYTDKCVGCGICEHVCVVDNPVAIQVKPRELWRKHLWE
ncbi:4Fe-4S dicluster domain-containing protein [Microaerobacter geothermalis]|uniref:4Fe-4S dicluster domain-containing protein n=1 Tax=Microaerobacter geothermalis TaxID=674972 RepID=UPI001F3979BE|nr:4Fe-4S dicluster domain-containing protein [Microaerobacter geothermalis]MCF6095237.1 4Fe-4S dicluster domain-containing protein [Microaerobacter geothermalis]